MFTIKPLKSDRLVRTAVFSFNENYAGYFSVALRSLLRHVDPKYLYDVVVLHGGLRDETTEKLESMAGDKAVLRFFDAGECAGELFGDVSHVMKSDNWAALTFYDLLVPVFLKLGLKRRVLRAAEDRNRILWLRRRLRAYLSSAAAILLAFVLAGCSAAGGAAGPASSGSSSRELAAEAAAPAVVSEVAPAAVSLAAPAIGSAQTPERGIGFSLRSGVYAEEELFVVLTAPEGCTVAYTEDGRIPLASDDTGRQAVTVVLRNDEEGFLIKNSALMTYPEVFGSFLLEDPSLPSGRVLRACVVSETGETGPAGTESYFPGMDPASRFPGCLVVSVVTDPGNLLDYETGILATGKIYDDWLRTDEAAEHLQNRERWEIRSNITQRGKAWERPCLLQIYDGGKTPAVVTGAGVRVTGDASRAANQKSFNVYFREDYGAKTLDYELFAGTPKYKSFRLMAGGNNAEWLKYKDAFLRELMEDRDFMTARSRTAVLFLNGEYWGPYLLTEKISDRMLQDRFGVDKDQVIVFKAGELEEGQEEDVLLYEELMSFAEKDLTDPENWEAFAEIMDIRSMADYCAARIYVGDADWRPDKNDVLWRTRDASFNGGRWQYIFYDAEFSSGMYGSDVTAPETDHFALAKQQYPLFAAAIRNREFYDLFCRSVREIGEENCRIGRVRELLSAYDEEWEPLLPDYYRRFGDTSGFWSSDRKRTEEFFEKRYALLMPMIEEAS